MTYDETDTLEVCGVKTGVNSRMTEYEMERFRDRAEALLEELDGYEVSRLVAYGSQRRAGVFVDPGHDPLGNGILTGNVEGFETEAVQPVSTTEVFIRFQQAE